MSYYGSAGSRNESPYRSVGRTPLRNKDYGRSPSVGGSRYESPYGRDRREIGSSFGRYGGERRQLDSPRFNSGGSVAGTISTDALNGRIDRALGGNSSRLSEPVSSYRNSSAPRISRGDYDQKSYSKLNAGFGSSTYHRPRELSEPITHSRDLSESRGRPRDFSEPRSRPRNFSEQRSHLRDFSEPRSRARDFSEPRSSFGGREYGRSRSPSFDKPRDYSRYSGNDYRVRDQSPRPGRDPSPYDYNRRRGEHSDAYDRPSDYGSRGRDDYGSRFSSPTREPYGRRDEPHRSVRSGQYERPFNDRRSYDGRSEYDDDFRRRGDYDDVSRRDDNRDRGTDYYVPPRNPSVLHVQNDYSQPRGLPTIHSDLSSVTGAIHTMPQSIGMGSYAQKTAKPMHSARSVLTSTSVASAWHGEDIVMIPKGQKASEVAVAATAAASLIADDTKGVCGFDAAAQSISNLADPKNGKDDVSTVINSCVIGKPQDELVLLPVSYTSVQESMKRDLIVSASVQNAGKRRIGSLPMDAYQFWARCTLLVATAILRAGPSNTQIAHAAAETVMMHGIASIHEDWLNTAHDDLQRVATEVNDVISSSPGGDDKIASLASVAILSEGGKTVAMERVRKAAPAPPPSTVPSVSQDTATFDGGNVSMDETYEDPIPERRNEKDKIGLPPRMKPMMPPVGKKENGLEIRSIRSTGSLLDADSSDDESEGNNARPATRLSTRTTADKTSERSAVADPSEASRKEFLAKTVNKLLTTPTEDGPETVVKRKTLRKPELDEKREEIAQRIQRIQMRAAAKRDMPAAVKHISKTTNASKDDSVEELASVKFQQRELSLMAVAGDIHVGDEDTVDDSEVKRNQLPPIPGSKVRSQGNSPAKQNGSIFTPVVNFLEKMACSMDFDDHDEEGDDEVPIVEKVMVTEQPNVEDDWNKFRDEMLDEADPKFESKENWETLESIDHEQPIELPYGEDQNDLPAPVKPEPVPYTINDFFNGPTNQANQGGIISHSPSTDSGAFSAVFDKGQVSGNSLKKLSLSTGTGMETSQKLFFGNQSHTPPSKTSHNKVSPPSKTSHNKVSPPPKTLPKSSASDAYHKSHYNSNASNFGVSDRAVLMNAVEDGGHGTPPKEISAPIPTNKLNEKRKKRGLRLGRNRNKN